MATFAGWISTTRAEPPKKRIVGIVIYDGAEPLDFAGPFEVFAMAHVHDDVPPDGERGAMGPMRRVFDVRVVAATTEPVTLVGGLRIVPTDTFDLCPPGGSQGKAIQDKKLVAWVAKQAAGAEVVTSVCTGSFVLGEAGLLDGKRSTTHHLSIDAMREQYRQTAVVAGQRFVEDGKVVTSAGVSAGIDLSLHVVAKLYGDGTARMTANIMEYPYPARP
jgi:transcriptional regulator GlxA family with amidase domain